MIRSAASILVVFFTALVALRAPAPRAAKTPPQPCGAGRYLLGAEVKATNDSPGGKALQIAADGASIPGVCTTVLPRILKATKKATKVRIEWPIVACPGFKGKKVILTGKLVDGCSRFVGKLMTKKRTKKLQGALSTCGDGTIDANGGAEGCEPPGSATCNAACQLPPGPQAAALGIASYGVTVPTDGRLLTGPVTVNLLNARGTSLGTITKTFGTDGSLSGFSSGAETASLMMNVEHRNFSPPLFIRITLTVENRSLQIDLSGQDAFVPGWLSTAILATSADALVTTPPVGLILPGETGTLATLPIVVDGQQAASEDDIARWFEATGLETLGLQSFAAAALIATLNDEPLAVAIQSHFNEGGNPPTPRPEEGIHPEFHKTPLCAGILNAIGVGTSALACGICGSTLAATPVTGIAGFLAVPSCATCAALTGATLGDLLTCKTSEYYRTTEKDCSTYPCDPGNGEVPMLDTQTEHACWCTCNDDRCDTTCGLFAQTLSPTFEDGSDRPALPLATGDCVNNDCVCLFQPDDYCKSLFPDYCSGGRRLGGRKFDYDCPRAACGDGKWTPSCPSKTSLNEMCDFSANAAGKKGSCQPNQGCGTDCKCVQCTCGEGIGSCPIGDKGGFCDPVDCQCKEGCGPDGLLCPPGKVCHPNVLRNGANVCIGQGSLRITLDFRGDADLDLHVMTPAGNEIYYGNRSADGGTLDVDSCVSTCKGGAENVYFDHPAKGRYYYWVHNFRGRMPAHAYVTVMTTDPNLISDSESLPAADVDSTHWYVDLL